MSKFMKVLLYGALGFLLFLIGYFVFVYYVPYSEGVRSGELIKISHKGYVVKTWEGEISQGISGAQIFEFSVMDNQPEAIEKLKELQGKFVKVNYVERYKTFFWWGDTRYFITDVTEDQSPFAR
ncbi:6-phosphogluconate dehydrogenase [Flavobacterium ponti]|jgi:hypothetical protein|uniref:6-phosphogluconate dehydrogenase n=1 Tax=Flavobacterium ponti TaxID=665133 RepID=A0ABV9P6P6_9FLAO